jgi:hypothetical protein
MAERRRFSDILVGWTVYPAGDLLAQLLSGGSIEPMRIVVMALAGGLLYRYEVPWWFRKLDEWTIPEGSALGMFARDDRHLNWLGRTVGAILYFNPMWVARHMLLIRLGSDPASLLPILPALRDALVVGAKSFLVNLPISFIGNYIIQMKIPLKWRFLASSIFSGILAAAYALAYRYF